MVNETLTHAERDLLRAVTGVAGVFPGTNGVPVAGTFPTKGTLPVARLLTGTITSGLTNGSYVVRGVGTVFTSEVHIDEYLYDGNKSVRKIIEIISDTYLILENAFPVDLAAATLQVCAPQTFKKVTAKSTGTVDAILQETTFKVGDDTVISGGAPIAYDASTTNAQISFNVSK